MYLFSSSFPPQFKAKKSSRKIFVPLVKFFFFQQILKNVNSDNIMHQSLVGAGDSRDTAGL